MKNKAQLIAEVKRLINGEEEGLIFFALKDYCNEATPQPNDLFEATTSAGQKVVRRYSEIKGKLRVIIWEESKTYGVDALGGEIYVQDKETAENLKKLSN